VVPILGLTMMATSAFESRHLDVITGFRDDVVVVLI